MARKAIDTVIGIGTAIIGMAFVTAIITRPNTAEIIRITGESQARMIRVMLGESYVERRDIPRFEELLGKSDDETITELFAGLSDADLDWVAEHLDLTLDPCAGGRCTDPERHAEGGHDR